MNFVRDVVEAAAPEAVAVVERTHSGDRREHTFASLADAARGLPAPCIKSAYAAATS